MGGLIVLLFLVILASVSFGLINSFFVRISGWTKSYQRLAKRYGTKVSFSGFRPKVSFLYGDGHCIVRNTGRSSGKTTQIQILWPDRKFKLFVSKTGQPSGYYNKPAKVELDLPHGDFDVYTNNEAAVNEMINATTAWKIKQIMELCGSGADIAIDGGRMRIEKPGFIKNEVQLDDFVRFGLELFDQFKLAINRDLEFTSDSEAVVLSEVTCPICSGKIVEQMVTCVRCKTPHCADCWEYNGQCATFACSETRFLDASAGAAFGDQRSTA